MPTASSQGFVQPISLDSENGGFSPSSFPLPPFSMTMNASNRGKDSVTWERDSVGQSGVSPTATLHEQLTSGGQDPTESDAATQVDITTVDDKDANVLIVDWDGPEDPQNPKMWSFKRKWTATAIVSAFTFISPVSSSMIAPATGQVAAEFGIHSDVVNAFITSIFLLAYAIGPLLFGPLSEIFGRYRVLQLSNLWYLVWNLACGFARNESQLLAFRFLAGLGGCAPLAIGGGVLGDCWRAEERGKALALYSLAPLLGPVIGPITGAWIAERSTWRWVFWATSIVDASIQVLGLFCLEETYAPVLLERRAEQIRKTMDEEKTTNREVRTVFEETGDRSWQAIMTRSMIRPFLLFFQEPIIQLLGVYMAYLWGMLFLSLTTMPTIFGGVYGQPVGIAGLHYIPLGIGLIGASQLNARLLDKVYIYFKTKRGSTGKPEYRLPPMFIGTTLLPIGLLITGWTVQAHTHWIVPDIGIALVGAGIILNFHCTQAYIVDAFTLHAASAMAAVSFLRSLTSAAFPLFGPVMYSAIGFGKGYTILAVAAIVIGCPSPWLFWHFGEKIRNSSRYAQN